MVMIREIKHYAKLVETIINDTALDRDEVLFNIVVELVITCRVSLINTR
jgi:hypothetical protein